MSKLCGIYCITHMESGRKYVGQSVDITKRLRTHSLGSSKSWIGKAVAKHGWSAFVTEIIELCEREHLNDAETRLVLELGSFAPHGFNLTTGGRQQFEISEETRAKLSFNAANISDETRAKIGAASKGRKFSPESIAKRVEKQTGSKRSNETRMKQSAAAIGKTFSAEHRANLALAAKARMANQSSRDHLAKINLGKKHTKESREKMSSSRIGIIRTPETCAKLSASLTGRVFSDDHKAKISASAKLRPPEYLQKMILAAKQPEAIAKRLATLAAKKLLSNNTPGATTGNLLPQIF